MSRPTKAPSQELLDGLRLATIIAEDIRAVLKKNKVPGVGDEEVYLLARFFLDPESFDAIKITGYDGKTFNFNVPIKAKGKQVEMDQAVLNALLLAKLFARGGEDLILALPKVYKRVLRHFKSPLAAVVTNLALNNSYAKYMPFPSDHWGEFWKSKTPVVAGNFARRLGLPVSPKVVEKARALIRKKVSPKT